MHYYSPYYLIPGSPINDMRNIPNPKEPYPTQYYSPEEGFIKGNLFKEEYVQYKNYVPTKPKTTNERESLLNEILMLRAAAHDLNLLLDNYPNDMQALKLVEEYNMRIRHLRDEYEKRYGALDAGTNKNVNGSSSYVSTPSPWLGR